MHLGWDKFSCMIYAANHSKHLPSVIMIGGNVSTLTASILFRALQSHSFEFCGYSDFFFISGGENKSPSPIAAMDCRLSGNVQSLQLQVFFFSSALHLSHIRKILWWEKSRDSTVHLIRLKDWTPLRHGWTWLNGSPCSCEIDWSFSLHSSLLI